MAAVVEPGFGDSGEPRKGKELVESRGGGGGGQHGLADVVADHYNKIKEVGIEARRDSRIFHMRSFNNWTKSMVIGEALEKLRKDRDYHAKITVLDMGCGKGGDLRKWKIGRIHHLICTDIATTSLDQCEDRYKEMVQFDQNQGRNRGGYNRNFNNRGRGLFTAEFFAADATKKQLRSQYRDPSMKIDLVSCQFAFHYCFESLEQAETMIKNAAECLSSGGFFIGTTPDSNDIVKRVRAAGKTSVGNEIYTISFDNEDILDENKKIPLFGAKYNFHLEGVVDCPEFLVHFPAFEKLALKYGLRLVMKKRFEDYYHKMKATPDGSNLLKKMNALVTYPPREQDKAGFQEEDYEHAKEFVADLRDERRRTVGTLSKPEWEAISLYLVFVFEKMNTKECSEMRKADQEPDRKRPRKD